MNAIGYEHINYEGRSQEFPGNAFNLAEQQLANELSSMRVPRGVSVTLFAGTNMAGQSLTLTEDAPDFRRFPGPGADGTWNDAANSVRIGAGSDDVRLTRGGQFVEAAGSAIRLVNTPTDAGRVALTRHDAPTQGAIRFSALFTQANVQLSIQNDGSLQTRPAGTLGPFEREQVFATTQPDGTSLLYRVDGVRMFGEPLLIRENV
jgi:hypothetical protein